jgi:hypothetical protein
MIRRRKQGVDSYPWFHSAWMNGPSLMVADIPFSPIVLMNFTRSYDPSKLNYNDKNESKIA